MEELKSKTIEARTSTDEARKYKGIVDTMSEQNEIERGSSNEIITNLRIQLENCSELLSKEKYRHAEEVESLEMNRKTLVGEEKERRSREG